MLPLLRTGLKYLAKGLCDSQCSWLLEHVVRAQCLYSRAGGPYVARPRMREC